MINVGIIGLGRIADLHHAAYVDNPGARLYAICDANPSLLEARKEAWDVAAAYHDYQELLADPRVDAVEIITPQTLHEAMVVDAARAGKHIAVQKPMAVGLDAAARMTAEASRAGVTFKVTDNYVFYPPIVLAKQLIDDGVIGDPITVRMKFIGGRWHGGWEVPEDTWAWRREEFAKGRGIQTFDHGHHMWATAWYLMGEFERVASWIDVTSSFIDCPAVSMWKHRDAKRYGTCEYTQAVDLAVPTDYYACDECFEVTGSAGMVLIRRCTGKIQEGPAVSTFTNDGWKHYEVESDWASGFTLANRNFIAAIRGEAKPLLTGEEAQHILRFAFALRRASDERREITLAEMDSEG